MVTDLGGFDSDARQLIKTMESCGWEGRRTSKGHWLGKAPDGTTTITVPPKMSRPNRSAQNSEAQFARWLRTQAPEELSTLDDVMTNGDDTVADDILRAGAFAKATDVIMSKVPPKLLSARPWLARKKHGPIGGERYESQAVVENHYSDGSVEFVCAFGCGYSNPNPKGVAVHYGRSHTMSGETKPAGEGPRHVDVTYTEPSFHREYSPQDRLVKALSEWLEDNWTTEIPMDEVAMMFLTWAHERPDLEHIERDVLAYTDTEMVQRIRAIVGQPFSVELKEAQEQMAAMQLLVDSRTAERDDASAHLVKVQRDLNAIKEMLGGIGL